MFGVFFLFLNFQDFRSLKVGSMAKEFGSLKIKEEEKLEIRERKKKGSSTAFVEGQLLFLSWISHIAAWNGPGGSKSISKSRYNMDFLEEG